MKYCFVYGGQLHKYGSGCLGTRGGLRIGIGPNKCSIECVTTASDSVADEELLLLCGSDSEELQPQLLFHQS